VNSLTMMGSGLVLFVVLVFLVVHFASSSAKNSKRADYAEKNLKIIKRFQTEMSRPLATGTDLVKRIRSRMRLP
jgi:uncharacterized membrane-anchored protein YhcB (DUF1043 family)